MRNLHTLIIGRTGTGKTTIVNELLELTARALILDVKNEYNPAGAIYCYTLPEASRALLAARGRPFKIVCRFEAIADYMRIVRLADHLQKVEAHGPLVIVLEEASKYSDTNHMPAELTELYNAGRHRRISLLCVIQVDTTIHRISRSNSEIIICCQQNKLSGDMQTMFELEEIQKLRTMKQEWKERGNSAKNIIPQQGVHFLVYPDDVDLYETWSEFHGHVFSSK